MPKQTEIKSVLLVTGLLVVALFITLSSEDNPQRPRLILQITVDQLRGDLINRYYDRLGDGGLRYLVDQEQVYTTAIAPTLSQFIGAKPPTGSMDESLIEVLRRD